MTRRRTDEGFTLLETMVALGIVGAVMASLLAFFVDSGAVLRRQADTQVAVHLAAGAMDYVSQLPGENVLLGRTEQAVRAQWRASAAQAHLHPTRTELAWHNPATATPSPIQTLPTTGQPIEINGDATPYERWWYIGRCWQPPTGGDCVVMPAHQRDQSVAMFRIIVAITWPSPDCPDHQCQYATAMLTEHHMQDPTWQ
jgi:prepilin-type N-terminal cleavage/methylation domain-containing protein